MPRRLLLAILTLCALSALSVTAHARALLQNDSFSPGDAVAFYTRINLEESFASIYDIPADHPTYRVCRVLALVGPNAFNIYAIRIGIPDERGSEIAGGLIWQDDDDAYQVFGALDRLNAIDLGRFDIVTDVRRLRVQMRVYGGAEPNIAADSDGISPGHNYVRVRLRNGQNYAGLTEGMDPAGSPPQPPGDWVMRVEIVRPNEACPGPDDPPIEPGDDVFDFGLPEDMGVDDMGVEDMGIEDLDTMVDPIDAMDDPIDTMPDPIVDSRVRPRDAEAEDMRRRDAEAPPADRGVDGRDRGLAGPLELTRIAPTEGAADRNTDVIINGRGFLDGGGVVRAELAGARLLDLVPLSGSTLEAVVPAGLSAGTHELRLTRADGQVAVLPAAFTIAGGALPPLRLDRLSPDSVVGGRPAELTVEGAGFTPDTTFSVGGAALVDVVIGPDEARGTLAVTLAAGIYDLAARRGDEVVRLEGALTVRGQPSADGCGTAPGSRDGWGFAGLLLALAITRRRRR